MTASVTSIVAIAVPASTPVSARISPPGSTTLALPTKRSEPKVPAWFAESQTIWFSSARARSNRSKRRFQRSSSIRGAGLVLAAGQADMHTIISAPSRARVRADSGKALS